MPKFDINLLLEEEEAVKGMDVPYRFGKRFDVNYSLTDGKWTEVDSGRVWLMKVTSPAAYSINFIFNELSLTERAELYIYSTDGSMVYGPVTSMQNLKNGLFFTDLVKGESVVLYLFEPSKIKESSKLRISGIIHAFKDVYAGLFESGKGLNDSDTCEKDVACYPAWGNESDAVARTIVGGGNYFCSGSLINNTAQDFKAYFLSAFHCVDLAVGNENSPGFMDGVLQPNEKQDAENWAFRFRYKKTSCDGSQVENYFTYNKDNFRAAWATTDFVLVELESSPLHDLRVAFLGWDRNGFPNSSGTGIHHPKGDVMKISFDNNPLTETSYWSNSGSNYWKVDWDIGVTEKGSSGSPLFDQNDRVIGQLTGGPSACGSSDMRDWYGCFYRSWTGDGVNSTDSTRLSNWVGIASTTNTIRYPHVTGPSMVCTSNSTFTLHDASPGSTVTWTASRVTPSSGSGTTATFHTTCSNIGNAQLTFTISNSYGSIQVSRLSFPGGPVKV